MHRLWGNTQHAGALSQPCSSAGFTLGFDYAAATARSVGAEGGAGSDDWEDLERNLG